MRKMFVSRNYYRELFKGLQSLAQGFKSVEDYHKEMKIVMIRVNIMKDREAILTRLLNDMNGEIGNMVELKHYIELDYVVHMAIKVKRPLKRKGNARQ